ncbi:DUF4762 family protein [Serratia ficaria]|uniref:DUF4762 domain-containing protein n=1 Tax=Serratia ficaria TaxID=61651 RepID=A0A240C9X2_SERFI|nr:MULTISPECIES: DUF4762 family protein [Serratia]MEE4484839.1 DUF4762 family protein [Serratia ficaria]REF43281.1 uncharacterized protein DUF4762 [Serratia ficaria]CAI0702243.1 Uncharacterised protein [Serratia ficaria]CAI1061716.1 Uncharacterised protein [Serratia ficaria]CAI1082154.1 Uncharacterised protein [Serratia ficaria]
MKKINLSEAEKIVGGTYVKTREYEWVGTGAAKSCMLVTTCSDKYGWVKKTYRPVAASNCPGGPVTPNR